MFGRSNRKVDEQSALVLPQLHFPIHAPIVGSDKKEFTVSVQRLDSSHGAQEGEEDDDGGLRKQNQDEIWKPGFWNRFPWLGFVALWFVVFASAGSVIVLVTSHNKSDRQWPHWISPNVILAGLNNAANIAITVAVAEGIAIAWWRKALRGATVKELHHSWAFSTNLSVVFFKYKYFNAVALAALTTKFAVIDGMLYQKATSTYPGPGNATTITMKASGYRHFPQTAYLNAEGNATGVMTYSYTIDLITWLTSATGGTISGLSSGVEIGICEGECFTSMLGAGFAVDCQSQQVPVNWGKRAANFEKSQAPKNRTVLSKHGDSTPLSNTSDVAEPSRFTDIPIFSVNFTQQWPDDQKDYSWISMKTLSYMQNGNSTKGSCPSLIISRECELRPAILNYTIQIQNLTSGATSSDDSNSASNYYGVSVGSYSNRMEGNQNPDGFGPDVVEFLDVHEKSDPFAPSALGGLQQALQASLGSQVLMTYLGSRGWKVDQTGTHAPIVQGSDSTPGHCDFDFDDPLGNILPSVNILTFLTMFDTERLDPLTPSPNATMQQNLTAVEYGTQIYYQSEFRYLYGALASTLVCILCILPAYWGFWELGRQVSLGPFEIANALQAPVFEPVPGGAGHVRDVLKAVGRQKVQYGDMIDDGRGGKKLRFS